MARLASPGRVRAALVVAALSGTLAATYPLLLGRSLVSPLNGPVAMLYDRPPFTFGARDGATENVRGMDVGSMMWAILPYTMVQREALAHGEAPLWNRHNLIGQPLWGQGQTFILDPVHLLSLAIPDPAWAMDLRFLAGRALFALGAGCTVMLVTGSLPAASLIAAVAPFAGHFTARFNHPAYFSIVYAPWVLAAFAMLIRATRPRSRAQAGALLACATFLQLVGSTPKEGMVTLVAVYVTGLAGLLVRPGRWTDALGRLDAMMLGAALAVLLSAPHWLVFLDTLGRAWTAYDQPLVQLAGWWEMVRYVLGAAAPGMPKTGVHPLLALLAVCALAQPAVLVESRLGLGALVALLLMSAVAFGVVPPALLASIPLVAHIHHVWDAFLAATVAPLVVLAGVGLAGIVGQHGRAGWWPVAAAAAIATVLFGWMVPGTIEEVSARVGLLSVSGAAIAVLGLLAVPAGWRRSCVVGIGAAAAILPGGLHLETGDADLDALLLQPRTRATLTAASPALVAMQEDGGAEPFRVAPVESVLFPGTQAYWGLEGTGGPDALRLQAVETLSDLSGIERTSWVWRTVLHPQNIQASSRFLDMLNVRFLLAYAEQVPPGARVLDQRGRDLLRVVERPTAWPRAFFTAGVHRHRDVREFARLLEAADGPLASVDAHEIAAVEAVKALPEAGAAVPATGYVLTPNTTAFRVQATGAGLAVLSESFVDRDFRATLNGRPVPYIRVNHAFKGVVIPGAGEWDVRFEYRPALWGWSWALAGVGALGLWGLLLVRDAHPSRRTPGGGADRSR
jgi:hypothetical protein